MTQEEILKYNKRCAEFLKLELAGPGFPSGYFYKEAYHHFEDLKFDSDWSWIMEVLCKIEETHHTVISQGMTGHYININRKDVNIMTATLDNPSKFMGVDKTKKEAVVQAINQFLIWYNENNNNRQS